MENNGDFVTSSVKYSEAVASFYYNTWCMKKFDSDHLKVSSELTPLVWEINNASERQQLDTETINNALLTLRGDQDNLCDSDVSTISRDPSGANDTPLC